MTSKPKMRRRSSVRVEVEAALTSKARTNPSRRMSMAGMLGDRPLTVYLTPNSVPCRTVWLLLLQNRIPHEVVNVEEGGREVKKLLEVISPFFTLPAIKDNANRVFGVPACLHYISEQYCGGEGFGQTVKEKARCESVLNWASNTLYRDVAANLVEQQLAIEENRSPDVGLSNELVTFSKAAVENHLQTLEEAYLSENKFLLGNEPLLADVHVAMTIAMMDMANVSLGRHHKVAEWMQRVRHHYGECWDTVCRKHNIRIMQRGSRRASVVA